MVWRKGHQSDDIENKKAHEETTKGIGKDRVTWEVRRMSDKNEERRGMKERIKKEWQQEWDNGMTGRLLYRFCRAVAYEALNLSRKAVQLCTGHGNFSDYLARINLRPEVPCPCSTNLVGKFTQSVRRIVQDVKDEGTATGATKEEVIETNERLRAVRVRMDESYDTAKKALVGLMGKYNDSKTVHNIFQRYTLLKAMIKEVIRLETQYWTLVDIPKQEKQETVPAFVLRACAIMEKSQKSGEGVKTSAKLAEEAQDKRERIERLENMTTSLIDAENTQMTNDLYRLLKKYSGLRNLIRQLKTEYTNAKIYPMVIRYSMLKDMIKDIMLHPDYMEVCHEVDA
nr:uncharacterized protein LOC111508113 [Leptinotarsa decemlineata]